MSVTVIGPTVIDKQDRESNAQLSTFITSYGDRKSRSQRVDRPSLVSPRGSSYGRRKVLSPGE